MTLDANRLTRIPVRWKRHRTARSLVAAFFRGMGGAKISDIEGGEDLVTTVRKNGWWGFCATFDKPPTVHYFAARGASQETLAVLLGHELGHIVGKPLKAGRAEEDRADEYGRVAVAVWRHLTTPRRKEARHAR